MVQPDFVKNNAPNSVKVLKETTLPETCVCAKRMANALRTRGTAMKKLEGQRFGRLTAIRPTEKREGTSVIWECKCDCGNIAYASSGKLAYGHIQSCGCLQKEKAADIAKKRILDLTGQRFGRLLVVRATDQRRNEKVVWECKCDCGNTAYIIGTALKNGNTASCGCLRKENMSKLGTRTGGKKPHTSNRGVRDGNE